MRIIGTNEYRHDVSTIGLVVKYLVANEMPWVRFPDGASVAQIVRNLLL